VQANRLTVVENLTAQKDTLVELYLSHNNIGNRGASQPTGLALKFTKLSTLDLSRNRVTTTSHFAHLEAMEDLWLSSNKISKYEDIDPLSTLGSKDGACLEAIYLEYNPIASEFDYRIKLASIIPSLKQIDANMIGHEYTYEESAVSGIRSVLKDPSVGFGVDVETALRKQQELAIEKAKEQMANREDDLENEAAL